MQPSVLPVTDQNAAVLHGRASIRARRNCALVERSTVSSAAMDSECDESRSECVCVGVCCDDGAGGGGADGSRSMRTGGRERAGDECLAGWREARAVDENFCDSGMRARKDERDEDWRAGRVAVVMLLFGRAAGPVAMARCACPPGKASGAGWAADGLAAICISILASGFSLTSANATLLL
jgi:hypothetical protein